ncbi:MAG: hypothetical protein UU32_C0011G0006 [Candidatus Woesebacteria bacterium GW2011_GWB1_41_10]|uniref:LytR/CpsA/Psr regulator C-terminal domain-containing protein n=1 Tax=Candidatus Woesebacteria bacterium GW2011_GWB1_41_10 TaxID=1618577 RepID=A0A0G0UGX6_9BACT|nr:MAG: hypothetical protein UU32_C0011G0006 [Candidatus Woesebacteria bacterium GW2011_GWB1_41_10]
MEENQAESPQVEQQESTNSGVSFPTVGQPQKAGKGKALLALGILALVGILGYLIFRSASSKEVQPSPTPTSSFAPVETPSPTSTAKPADKNKVKIEIQNGTGITGEAVYLQTQLKALGYSTISVGNASSQNNATTTVTFSKNLSSDIVDELTKKLKDLYKEVETKTSASTSIDVVIVTGLRKGATAKPSASATPKASATPTATSTSTAIASPTPTPTTTTTP